MKLPISRNLIIVVVVLVLFVVLPLLILSFNAPLRMLALSATKGVYEVQRRYVLERYLVEPVFSVLAEKLNNQIDVIEAVNSSRPRWSAEFIETVDLVMANARFKDDFVQLKPVLARLSALEPKSYLPQLWHAQAALETHDPEARVLIERAIALMPADDRGYRLAYRLALRESDQQQISRICTKWQTAQFGGLKFPKHYAKRSGASQRRMIMQGETETGGRVVVGNMGMENGTRRRYVFRFDKKVLARMFTLRLAVFPGTRLAVHKTELLTTQGWDSIPERSVQIIPSHGYFDKSGDLILSYRGDQIIRFILSDPDSANPIMEEHVAGIAIEATISKLPIFLNPACAG